jgi:hypothetical protein
LASLFRTRCVHLFANRPGVQGHLSAAAVTERRGVADGEVTERKSLRHTCPCGFFFCALHAPMVRDILVGGREHSGAISHCHGDDCWCRRVQIEGICYFKGDPAGFVLTNGRRNMGREDSIASHRCALRRHSFRPKMESNVCPFVATDYRR